MKNKDNKITKDVEKLILKYLDNSKDFWCDLFPLIKESKYSYFGFYDILTELIKDNKIIIKPGNNINYLKLTKKGELINKNELLFRINVKETKIKWFNQSWVGYVIAFLVFIYTVYQDFEKDNLKSKVSSLKYDNDTLTKQLDSLKIEFSTLNALHLDLMNNVEIQNELEKLNNSKNEN